MIVRFLSRRDIFKSGSLLAALPFFGSRAQAKGPLTPGPGIFESIGVRPIINCKGTYTIISGSQSLPEVKLAMESASHHYVHMDELMAAAGQRLHELTQADWGMVSSGCAAALAHATAACICGADPEKLQRLPDTRGLKNEVIAPAYSRNVYDHAVRGTGAKMVTVRTRDEYIRAFNDRTAMIMILAGEGDDGPLGTAALAPLAREKGVPILVDAAAERLTIPNLHLKRGATLVAYSGGKCLRGPQAGGLLLGRKDLVQTAFIHSAPHHAFGRPMKAGKEEIMGMLAAVEMWVKRDHKKEWAEWESWIEHIGQTARKVEGVSYKILQPVDLSNNAPQIQISWNGEKLGISGTEVERTLLNGSPRIIVGGASGDARFGVKDSSITIMPYMMMPGDSKLAAERIHAILANPPKMDRPTKPSGPPAEVSGQWDVEVKFLTGEARHGFVFEQKGETLVGTHAGEFLRGDVRGMVHGDEIFVRTSHAYEGTSLGYDFLGKVSGNTMSGTVDLGEYGRATFTARRHRYSQAG